MKRMDGRQIALLLISLAGVILAVVGLFITWYVCKLEADVNIAGHYEEVQTWWLFDKSLCHRVTFMGDTFFVNFFQDNNISLRHYNMKNIIIASLRKYKQPNFTLP